MNEAGIYISWTSMTLRLTFKIKVNNHLFALNYSIIINFLFNYINIGIIKLCIIIPSV